MNRVKATTRLMFGILIVLLIARCGGGDGGSGPGATPVPGGGGIGSGGGAGAAPVVELLAETSVTESSAALNGSVIPNNQRTDFWFEYGTESSLAIRISTPPQSVGSEVTSQTVRYALSGLESGKTYYYRIVAVNGVGEAKSATASFTTSSPGSSPAVTTLVPTSVSSTSATLNGNVTPNGLATDARFEWGPDPNLGTPSLTPLQTGLSGTSPLSITAQLTGLTAGATYYYRVVASNSTGISRGAIIGFPTAAATDTIPPTVSITAPANGATNVNSGTSVNAVFSEAVQSSTVTTTTFTLKAGSTSVPGTVTLNGTSATFAPSAPLANNTLYTATVTTGVRDIAGNAITADYTWSFTTGAAPSVASLAATSVSITSAVLNGNVTPNGLATDARFEWGADPNLGTPSLTPLQTGLSGTSPLSITAQLTGLTAGATYYYRVVASNSAGTTKGTIRSFRTFSNLSGYFDDFSIDTTIRAGDIHTTDPYTIDLYDTTGGYTVKVYASVTDWVAGENEGMLYRSDFLLSQAHTSINHGVAISHDLPSGSQGIFSMDFYPIKKYGDGAGIVFRLRQDAYNYFEISNGVNDGWGGIPTIKKVVGGTTVYQKQFTDYYSQGGGGTNYPIKVTFSPTLTTWEAFGLTDVDPTPGSISVGKLELDFFQQEAFIDNIRLQAVP